MRFYGPIPKVVAALLLLAASLGLVYLILVLAPPWLVSQYPSVADQERLDAEHSIRVGLVAMVALLCTLGGLVFTAKTYWANQQVHFVARMNEAVKNLSSQRVLARSAAVLGLQEIARRAGHDVRVHAMKILCQHLRESIEDLRRRDYPPGTPTEDIIEAVGFVSPSYSPPGTRNPQDRLQVVDFSGG